MSIRAGTQMEKKKKTVLFGQWAVKKRLNFLLMSLLSPRKPI